MSSPPQTKLRIGDWQVDPAAGQIARAGKVLRLEARTLRLLLDLAEHAGEVVSIDELLDRVWAGVTVTPDSVYQAVAALRRLLGDDPRRPRYIATVPRLGYRLVARVGPWTDEAPPAASADPSRRALLGVGALAVAAVAGLAIYGQMAGARRPPPPRPATSVGVLTFLDMTDRMDSEPLTWDLTEAVVDRLSQAPPSACAASTSASPTPLASSASPMWSTAASIRSRPATGSPPGWCAATPASSSGRRPTTGERPRCPPWPRPSPGMWARR
jgi:DNA-binding winged helix-turn-helix (wHTH) protein